VLVLGEVLRHGHIVEVGRDGVAREDDPRACAQTQAKRSSSCRFARRGHPQHNTPARIGYPFCVRVSSSPGLLDPQALRERHLQVKCGTYVSQSEARVTTGSPAMPPLEAQKRLGMTCLLSDLLDMPDQSCDQK
jgi:hypothetical protein